MGTGGARSAARYAPGSSATTTAKVATVVVQQANARLNLFIRGSFAETELTGDGPLISTAQPAREFRARAGDRRSTCEGPFPLQADLAFPRFKGPSRTCSFTELSAEAREFENAAQMGDSAAFSAGNPVRGRLPVTTG